MYLTLYKSKTRTDIYFYCFMINAWYVKLGHGEKAVSNHSALIMVEVDASDETAESSSLRRQVQRQLRRVDEVKHVRRENERQLIRLVLVILFKRQNAFMKKNRVFVCVFQKVEYGIPHLKNLF